MLSVPALAIRRGTRHCERGEAIQGPPVTPGLLVTSFPALTAEAINRWRVDAPGGPVEINMRRRLYWAAAAALSLLGAIGILGVYATHTVALDEREIQTVLDKETDKDFPVNGAASAVVKSVRAKSATVRIRDGRATFAVDVEGLLRNGRTFALTATARGAPRYVDGAFYFQPEQVEVRNLSYENINASDALAQLGARLGKSKIGQLIESNAQLAQQWATGIAETAARQTFERRPVYRIKDDAKGLLLRSALESVTIDDDRIVVVFSLWRLTVSVVMGAVGWIVAAVLVIFLVRNPLAAAADAVDIDLS
jgi:cell division protein FtsB